MLTVSAADREPWDVTMQSFSEQAGYILDRMEPERLYTPQDLRAFVPDSTIERVRETMHELWIHRQVERVEYAGWRRLRPASPDDAPSSSRPGGVQIVKPEELFDHARFAGFFK